MDNQWQDDLPQLLKAIRRRIWLDRDDWFFAVAMGLHDRPDQPALVPEALLALGVPHLKDENGRLRYVVWEEGKFPDLVLEVVSQNHNGEYEWWEKTAPSRTGVFGSVRVGGWSVRETGGKPDLVALG